jgi:hypothetical protein
VRVGFFYSLPLFIDQQMRAELNKEEDDYESDCIKRASAHCGAFLSGPADAAGCLKGAVVGGVAGHYAGNHGLLGAGAGCLVGRHYAKKHARQEMNNNNTGDGSSRYNAGQYR